MYNKEDSIAINKDDIPNNLSANNLIAILKKSNVKDVVASITKDPQVNGADSFRDVKGKNHIIFSDKLINIHKKDALLFVFAHELAHIINGDVNKENMPYLNQTQILAASLLVSAITIFIKTSAIFQLVCLTYIGIYTAKSRVKEKNADITAIKLLGNAEGGIEFFENNRKNNPQWLDAKIFNFINTHPSTNERIQYLKEWEQNNKLNKDL